MISLCQFSTLNSSIFILLLGILEKCKKKFKIIVFCVKKHLFSFRILDIIL